MDFDPTPYIPQVNKWFKSKITYKGVGYAEFLNPKGWIKGPIEIRFDEIGDYKMEMQIEDFHCECSLNTNNRWYDFDLDWLITGIKPHVSGEPGNMMTAIAISIEAKNKCTSLRIEISKGVFKVIGEIDYHPIEFDPISKKLRFSFQLSRFDSNQKDTAKYWVIPLINFISEPKWYWSGHPLNNHPLRIYQSTLIPETIPEDDKRKAIPISNGRNLLIPFGYPEIKGFIELLPDFAKRKEKLKGCKACKLVTAVMVGEIGENSIEWDEITKWFPLDYIHVLSLSSGSLVGTPWIEFRDAQGNLVSRIHTQQSDFPFFKGHKAVDMTMGGGLGWLLTQSDLPLEANLRTAIKLMVMGGQDAFYVEDRKAFLFRAFDTLTKEYRQKKTPDSISEEIKGHIKTILTTARDDILKVKPKTKGKTTTEETKAIDRIAGIVIDADRPKTIGDVEGILLFIDELGLNDAKAIRNANYEKKWIARYTEYRSKVIHESFFETEGKEEFLEIVQFMYHLYDLLLRSILKILNYDGQYNRAIPIHEHVSIDWVQPDTPLSELGYKQI